jgi:hypothetical protein
LGCRRGLRREQPQQGGEKVQNGLHHLPRSPETRVFLGLSDVAASVALLQCNRKAIENGEVWDWPGIGRGWLQSRRVPQARGRRSGSMRPASGGGLAVHALRQFCCIALQNPLIA